MQLNQPSGTLLLPESEDGLVGGPVCEPPTRIWVQVDKSWLHRASQLATQTSRSGLGPGTIRDGGVKDEFCPFTMRQVCEMERGRKRGQKIKGTGRLIRTDAPLVLRPWPLET